MCQNLNIPTDYINNSKPYGWLKRANRLENYNFRNACNLVDPNIYKDFSFLSGNIHNTDMYTKTNWVDMQMLTKFLFLLYDFTEKMIKIYNPHIIRRKQYHILNFFRLPK